MSINFKKKTIEAAAKYNAKSTYVLPPAVLNMFPDLAHPRDSLDFAWGVVNAQLHSLGFRSEQVDGMLGHGTYTALLRAANPIDSEYVVMDNCRVSLPIRSEYKLITFDEPNGLDLHKFGKFSKRKEAPSALVLHWGGLNAKHCYDVMASDQRDVSTHFLIGKTAADEATVYQVLDMKHSAWHAGSVNGWTIGIDICQSPEVAWESHYMVDKAGTYQTMKVRNDSGRGPVRVLSIDPVLARAVELFVQDLATALGFSISFPASHDVYPESELRKHTVMGHHHSNERKYDMACWHDAIFPSYPVAAKGGSTGGANV